MLKSELKESLSNSFVPLCFLCLFVALILIAIASQVLAQKGSRSVSLPAQIHGQVRYASGGAPVDHALVRLQSFRGGVVSEITTDRTGKFSFTGLVPDQYTVIVRLPGFSEEQQHVDLDTAPSQYVLIQLSADTSAAAASPRGSTRIVNANASPEAQAEFDRGRTELIDNKDIDRSVTHLEKAVELSPNFLEAQLLLGTAYVEKHKLDKAERTLLRAIEINPKVAEPQIALGEVYRQQKRYQDAEKILTSAIRLGERSAPAHLTLARIYWDFGLSAKDAERGRSELEKSWQEINIAMRLSPNLPEAHLLAGNLLFKAHRAKDALPEYETYLRLDPSGEFASQTRDLVQKIRQALSESR